MTGDPLPDDHHVSRYCSPRAVRDGRILPKAFQLRRGEDFLSVNWLEWFAEPSRSEAISRVRARMIANGFGIRANGRFAVLHVGAVKRVGPARDESGLSVVHLPTADDDSHAGIGGYAAGDAAVASHLVDLVTDDDIYPARP